MPKAISLALTVVIGSPEDVVGQMRRGRCRDHARCTSVRGASPVNSGIPAPSTMGARTKPSRDRDVSDHSSHARQTRSAARTHRSRMKRAANANSIARRARRRAGRTADDRPRVPHRRICTGQRVWPLWCPEWHAHRRRPAPVRRHRGRSIRTDISGIRKRSWWIWLTWSIWATGVAQTLHGSRILHANGTCGVSGGGEGKRRSGWRGSLVFAHGGRRA
jgi:hypothetical protein